MKSEAERWNEENPILNLLGDICTRAKELGNMKMDELRETNGYGCDTPGEAKRANQHFDRGQLIEAILSEEFDHTAKSLQDKYVS